MAFLLIVLACVALLAFFLRRFRIPIRHRWRRHQARTMFAQLSGPDRHQPAVLHYARLRAMDALAFEELLLEAFEQRGFRVIRNHRYTGDGGIDGQVVIGGRTWLIQAKRYSSAVKPDHVRDFARLCAQRGQPGLFIHTGRTGGQSRNAVSHASGIEIISGNRLLALLTGSPFPMPGTTMPVPIKCSPSSGPYDRRPA